MANVKVLTVDDVDIKKWRWWSNWIDIAVFNFGGCGYLLQMSVSRNNSKRFKTTPFKTPLSSAEARITDVDGLIDMNKKLGKNNE